MNSQRFTGLGFTLALLLAAPAPAQQARPDAAQIARDDEMRELKRQLGVVLSELDRLRTQMALPEEPGLESAHGLGPAASKVYGARRGLALGGYAEAVYRNQIGDAKGNGEDEADFLRLVLYTGYKFSDRLLFNAEIEIEHASTSQEGEVSVEFASLEYLARPELNLRGGLLLVPMGFLNEMHEPPFFYGTQRPEPERQIIPSTWRENGVGIFGSFGESLSYRAYLMNGLDASGYSSSGLRGGRQKGSEAKATDLAFVGRLDFQATPSLLVGGSYYVGDSGQGQTLSESGLKLPSARTSIWEVHGDYQSGPLQLRGLYTQAHISDAGALSAALSAEATAVAGTPKTTVVAERMIGGYAEVAYDIMQLLSPGTEKSLTPFFRFEYLDTQNKVPSGFTRDRTEPRRLFIPGVQFKPNPNVVLKLDYRNISVFSGNAADTLNLGMGLVF